MSLDSQSLADFLLGTSSLTVLTGAGVSTGSGIPDYRDKNGDSKVKTPIQYQDFVGHPQNRQRYWARSYLGWQRFSKAAPNAAHDAISELESSGRVDALITQNVDGLHDAAGSSQVIDLHGSLSRIICLDCRTVSSRTDYQRRLQTANPDWHARVFAFKPDGDAEVAEASLDQFAVPACEHCGGIIKPDVVMFGENVPKERVAVATNSVERSDGLLIIGSSMMVFSGFRFARQANALGKPICIVNQGKTRADALATLKLEVDCVSVLPAAISKVAEK